MRRESVRGACTLYLRGRQGALWSVALVQLIVTLVASLASLYRRRPVVLTLHGDCTVDHRVLAGNWPVRLTLQSEQNQLRAVRDRKSAITIGSHVPRSGTAPAGTDRRIARFAAFSALQINGPRHRRVGDE